MRSWSAGRDELVESLRRVVAEVLGRPQEHAPRAELTLAEVGLDSLSQLEVLNRLEDQYRVMVPYEVADQLRTVGDVLDVLGHLVAARTATAAPGGTPAAAGEPAR